MGRAWLVLPLLLALAATAWFLWPAPRAEPGAEGALPGAPAPPSGAGPLRRLPPEPAHLSGRGGDAPQPVPAPAPHRGGAAPRASDVPGVLLQGAVRDERGAPLGGALVYQLPREAARGRGWVRAQVRTGVDGAFLMTGAPTRGTWIAVRAWGRRTVFLDGDAIDAGQPLDLVLEEAPPLVVHVVDGAGEPVAGATIRAIPVARAGPAMPFPGPASGVPEQLEMTDAQGRAEMRFEIAVPVVLLCETEGLLAHPREQRAEEAAGTFVFEALEAAGIAVKAVDRSGERIREHLHVTLLDPATGEELAVYQGSQADGALEAEPALTPGPYPVEVSARGYEPAVIPALVLPPGPGVAERTVTLDPLAESARLRLLLPPVLAGRTPCTLLLRRLDPGWIDLGWRKRSDHRMLAAGDGLEVPLRPGTWEAVATRSGADVAGVLAPFTLVAGATVERRAQEVGAVSFPLYSALPSDLGVRALRVRAPGFGLLPLFGVWTGSRPQDAAAILSTIAPPGSALRRDENGGALLGPYPGDLVVLEVDDWGGTTRTYRVGR